MFTDVKLGSKCIMNTSVALTEETAETAKKGTEEAKEKAQEVKEKTEQKAHETKESVKPVVTDPQHAKKAAHEAASKTAHKTHETKEKAKETAPGALPYGSHPALLQISSRGIHSVKASVIIFEDKDAFAAPVCQIPSAILKAKSAGILFVVLRSLIGPLVYQCDKALI